MCLQETLGWSANLLKLDVAWNLIIGTISPDFRSSGRLDTLVLMGNGLYGEIPTKLGECKSSIRVRLAKNYLKGLIPAGFFNLPSNTMLEPNDNALSEEMPTLMVGDVLSKIDLSNNFMSGPIPSAIDKLPTLQTLSLDSNRFSGAIPPEVE
ncbi:hypothetical protein ZIOFF_053556 [Zingiber officinale]|uniref:Uncharacterized protein n=1 Tax=Zingiber officinale TaxID=94328 RepID=A0A8J5KIM9_ZINOF|nr:hypothetical protein ZIOFF_053556 [Zingiber officinale]